MAKNLHDKWMKRLADEDKAHKSWRKRAADADKAYCDYGEEAVAPLFPVFKTTIDLIHGRIYGQPPKPDVRKRHPSGPQDQGMAAPVPQGAPQAGGPPPSGGLPPAAPAGVQGGMVPSLGGVPPTGAAPTADPTADDNTISLCLERALSYTIDTTLFDRDAHMAVNDFLVSACGIAKVEMETETDEIPAIDPATMQPMLDEEGKPLKLLQITSQELNLRHFHHSQFHWEPCKDWRRCGWVAFDHYMTKEEIEDTFKVTITENIKESGASDSADRVTGSKKPQQDKYKGTWTVHEIWDKDTKQRIWVSDCYPKELEVEDDPLELEDFFPCPAPMMANVSGVELLPSPDYYSYQDLVMQANVIAERIREITKQVKDISFYDAAFEELKRASEYSDGAYIAVKDLLGKLRSLNGKATADSVIYHVEMAEKVEVLQQLMQQLEWIKTRIYEINGIADIQRGVSDPRETLGAQKIKNDWADIRTGQRVQVVALFFRDVFRIMAQLIGNKFAKSQIEAMSGVVLNENQIATMRSELVSCYAVDVESDSTMVQDDAATQEQTMLFLNTFSDYMLKILPGVQNGMVPADLAKEGLLLIKDSFKAGRQLEQAINTIPNTLQQLQGLTSNLQQAQQQTQQLQQQNADLQKQLQQHSQAQDARENFKAQSDAQAKQTAGQNEAARVTIDASKVQVDNAVKIAGVHQQAHDSQMNHAQKAHDSANKAQQQAARPQ